MKRIAIIGTSCSGKTYLAKQLAYAHDIPHIELDELHWKPNWQEHSDEEFCKMVSNAISGDAWVIDGNYSVVRERIWSKVETIIWLNYPLSIVLFRAIKRSIIRAFTKEKLFSGNIETFRQSFFSRDSIILWVLKTHYKRKRTYKLLLNTDAMKHVEIMIFRHPKQARDYIQNLL